MSSWIKTKIKKKKKKALQRVDGWIEYLGGAESLVDGLGGLDGGAVDAPVEEEHHQHRNEEATQGRINDVTGVIGQFAGPVVAVLLPGRSVAHLAVVPSHQRRETDEKTQ